MADRIKTGDRVRPKFSHPEDDDYDVGKVVGWENDGTALVAWERAGETYNEDRAQLEHAPEEG